MCYICQVDLWHFSNTILMCSGHYDFLVSTVCRA